MINSEKELKQQTVVITGGYGVLGASLCKALAEAGANVAILGRNEKAAHEMAKVIRSTGGRATGFRCDVLDKANIEAVADQILTEFGQIDILINAAGGNKPQATTSPDLKFFDLPADAFRWVLDLNLLGTILPSQIFGKIMANQKHGIILNISSMNSFRPLTRIPAYSAAKAGVSCPWIFPHRAKSFFVNR